jgi:hypothetical protein
MSQRNVIRSRGTAIRNQTRICAKRIMHISEDKSRDLEAHDGSTWVGGVGTNGHVKSHE